MKKGTTMNKIMLLIAALMVIPSAVNAKMPMKMDCTGILQSNMTLKHPTEPNYTKDKDLWCDAEIAAGRETKVLSVCSVGDTCQIKGVITGHGAFEWIKIDSVRKVTPKRG